MVQIIRIEELAKELRADIETLRGWRKRGYGPRSAKLGNRLIYLRTDVDDWLKSLFDDDAEGTVEDQATQQ